jgi:hypothetical protein
MKQTFKTSVSGKQGQTGVAGGLESVWWLEKRVGRK